MTDSFDLPVRYQGEERFFPAQLLQFGYTHKFQVEVNGTAIFFEPDEERHYRALIEPEQLEKTRIEVALLQAIAAAIEVVLK